MKLSELAYNAVKNVTYFDDASFTYNSFITGEYNDDPDYRKNIVNVFAPLNEAIHRLSDRNKIKHVTACLGVLNKENYVSFEALDKKVKKIVSVFIFNNNDYFRLNYREFGKGIFVIGLSPRNPIYIEFIEDIKNFSDQDIVYTPVDPEDPETEWVSSVDFDVDDIGINETMCGYIIEYVQGKLQEPIAPELANMHITRAEQYFDDLEEQQTPYTQQVVENKYRII